MEHVKKSPNFQKTVTSGSKNQTNYRDRQISESKNSTKLFPVIQAKNNTNQTLEPHLAKKDMKCNICGRIFPRSLSKMHQLRTMGAHFLQHKYKASQTITGAEDDTSYKTYESINESAGKKLLTVSNEKKPVKVLPVKGRKDLERKLSVEQSIDLIRRLPATKISPKSESLHSLYPVVPSKKRPLSAQAASPEPGKIDRKTEASQLKNGFVLINRKLGMVAKQLPALLQSNKVRINQKSVNSLLIKDDFVIGNTRMKRLPAKIKESTEKQLPLSDSNVSKTVKFILIFEITMSSIAHTFCF